MRAYPLVTGFGRVLLFLSGGEFIYYPMLFDTLPSTIDIFSLRCHLNSDNNYKSYTMTLVIVHKVEAGILTTFGSRLQVDRNFPELSL